MDSGKLIRGVLRRLPVADQIAVLDELGLREKQADALTLDESRALLFGILRRINLPDDEFRDLAKQLDLVLKVIPSRREVEIRVPLVGSYSSEQMPLNEIAAASVVIWQVSHRVAHVVELVGLPGSVSSPTVAKLESGSISFSLAGSSYLIGGIGLILLAYTALPLGAAGTFAYAGGIVSAAMGIVEAALNWYKTVKETSKLDSEIRLNELNLRKGELEIEKMRIQLPPASSVVPAEIIATEARRLGIQQAVAAQMLNEALPSYSVLANKYPSPISVASTGSAAASASTST